MKAWVVLLIGIGCSLVAATHSTAQDGDDANLSEQNITSPPYDIKLINLNPAINKWFILELYQRSTQTANRYHLDNVDPNQRLTLNERGITISTPQGPRNCLLWASRELHIERLPTSDYANPFFPLCEGLLYLRLPRSSNTQLSLTEWGTEILRRTDFGEDLINTVKPVLVNMGAEQGEEVEGNDALSARMAGAVATNGPASALVANAERPLYVKRPPQFGFELATDTPYVPYGKWLPVKMHPGIYASLMKPGLVAADLLQSYNDRVFPLAPEEADKLVYMVAYDLRLYGVTYAVGTIDPPINFEAPGLNAAAKGRQKSVVPIGSIPPYALRKGVGVFVGGFKRRHGVVRSGPHAGKYYGYIENGVELEPMSSGLQTLYADNKGEVTIGAWPSSSEDIQRLRQTVVSARQNGVAIVSEGIPGPLVNSWQGGNWSADAQGVRRSLRSGVCIQTTAEGGRYLIFMAFTSATPSSMARVMQAYRCQEGMHLDMNAYMYMHNALYTLEDGKRLQVEYLNKEMLYPPGLKRHRFILDNNSRDFFYVQQRDIIQSAADASGPQGIDKERKTGGKSASRPRRQSIVRTWQKNIREFFGKASALIGGAIEGGASSHAGRVP